VWVPLAGEPPARIHHRVAFVIPASSRRDERVVQAREVAVRADPLVIGPPLRGEAWVARWSSNTSFHRRGSQTVDGRAVISQRFAIDWDRFGPDDRNARGEGAKNEDYAAFGQEAIAVADSVVAKVIDGIPPNTPPNVNPAVPITIETAAGNSVVLRLQNGLFATYAHLQPHSIRVKEGDRVTRGQMIGLVGNSGNAIGPHLHFHIATAPLLEGEGMPYEIDRFEQLGTEPAGGGGDSWTAGRLSAPIPRRNEFPSEHMVVRFQ